MMYSIVTIQILVTNLVLIIHKAGKLNRSSLLCFELKRLLFPSELKLPLQSSIFTIWFRIPQEVIRTPRWLLIGVKEAISLTSLALLSSGLLLSTEHYLRHVPTSTMTTENLSRSSSDAEARANLFPQYLMKLLNDEVAPAALWWLPDGNAFALDPKKIDGQVLDKYFQKTKYSSFIRRLHNEGFRRQTRRYKKVDGLDLPDGAVVLSHDLFQREHPQLLEGFYVKKAAASVSNAVATAPKAFEQATEAASETSDARKVLLDKGIFASGTGVAAAGALRETDAAALFGLSQARLRPTMTDAHTTSSMFGRASLPPLTLGGMGMADRRSSNESLSKTILALRQARLELEVASDEAARVFLLQQGALKNSVQSWPRLGGRGNSSESCQLPRSSSPDSSSAAGPSPAPLHGLDTQLQLQQLCYENSRRQILEEQGKRLSAVEALRRAAFARQWR
jgi:HSF-type DNA-binding